MKKEMILAIAITLVVSPNAPAQTASDTIPGVEAEAKEQRKQKRRGLRKRMRANRPPEARYVRMADKLPGLSTDQKQKIEAIKIEMSTERQKLKTRLKSLRSEMQASKGPGSESKDKEGKESKKEQVQQLRQSIRALQEQSWKRISSILSEEQINKLKVLKPTPRNGKMKDKAN